MLSVIIPLKTRPGIENMCNLEKLYVTFLAETEIY